MDVLIFGGQSNMQGQTEGCPIVNEEVKNAYEYRKQINEIIPLKHPVGEDFTWEKLLLSSHNGGGSLVPDFCHIYAKKTGRKVLAIHVARGSTTIAEWQKGTQRYHVMAEKIKRGIEKASEIEKVEHIYYVWLQGESDAIIETTKEDYLESLIRYKNNLPAIWPDCRLYTPIFSGNHFHPGLYGRDMSAEISFSPILCGISS